MKRLLLLLLCALPIITMGQITEIQTNKKLRLIEKLYYDRGVYIASEEERAKLKDLVFEMRGDSTLKVHIVGFSDKWGGKEVNDRFSYVRAMYIGEWMKSCRVSREQIIFVGGGIDTMALNDAEARRVEILQIVETIEESQRREGQLKEAPTTEMEDARAAKPIEDVDVEMQVEPEIESQTSKLSEQNIKTNNFTLRTNLLYWAGGMMNIGVEYKKAESNFGFLVNGGYSPFGNTNWNHSLGGWFVAPEVRYHLPRNKQWFVGAQFLAGGYNIKLSDTGRQGSVISGGVMGGYRLTLSDTFDMDFTLGLGYGHFEYDTYDHDDATSTNPYIAKRVSKSSIIPIQTGVNLIWKIK